MRETGKSFIWTINAQADVNYEFVTFDEEIDEKEAIRRFKEGKHQSYIDIEPNFVIKVLQAWPS